MYDFFYGPTVPEINYSILFYSSMYDSGNHEDMSRAHNFSQRRGKKLIDIKMTMHDNKQSMCDIILIRVM